MNYVYHIARKEDWEQARKEGSYAVSTFNKTLDQVGYIHLSFDHQVKKVAYFIYKDQDNLLLLKINPGKLKSKIKIESPEGTDEKFPHLYGELNLNSVEEVMPYSFEDISDNKPIDKFNTALKKIVSVPKKDLKRE